MTESKKTNTEKETDITEPLKKSAQEAKEAAAETVEAVKKTTKRVGRKARQAATSAKKTMEEKSATAKETVEAVKKTAKETAASVKKTAKKEYTKAALKETYIQVDGCEYKESEILAKVEQAYVDAGNKLTSMKSLQLYIKPEDAAAYYVINKDITGKVEL